MVENTKKPLPELLRDHVIALMKAAGKAPTATALRKKTGIGTSGAQAILGGDGDPRISTVQVVAKAFKCEAWELLHPGFVPKDGQVSPEQAKAVESLAKEVESLTAAQRELLRKLVKA